MMNWTLEVEDVACPVDDILEENGRVHALAFRVGGPGYGIGKGRTGVQGASRVKSESARYQGL
jgi:hypothetical protein